MKYRPWLYTTLGCAAYAVAACGDDPTQPNRATDQPAAAPVSAVGSNTWSLRRDEPFERWDVTVAEVPNAAGQSILYVIGGRTATGAPLGRVRAYNVATNKWTSKPDLPRPLSATNGAGVVNGRIYVSGGLFDKEWYDEGVSSGLYMYNPATNTWTRKRDMPDWGAWGVTGVIKGKLYVLTTCVEEPFDGAYYFDICEPSKFFRYNPATDRWTTLPSPKGSFNENSGGAVLYDKLYVTNGDNLEMYDPATKQWITKKTGGQRRVGAAATALGAKLYLMGGRGINSEGEWETFRTMRVYHPITDTWSTVAPMPTARDGIAAARVFLDGRPRIEVVGGSLPGNNLQYIP